MENEYNQNPEEIQEGEEIDGKWQFCGVCFETITQPILEGIWYHSSGGYDHSPIIADTFLQLFLMYEHHGNGTLLKISKYDDNSSLACPCYLQWFNLLRKKNIDGFQDNHYYNSSGVSLCKVQIIGLTNHDITECDYPEKQGYLCEICISKLIKKKVIKITLPTGKNKSKIFNKIIWLKKYGG